MKLFKQRVSQIIVGMGFALAATAFSAQAALPVGASAPDFQLHAALGGKPLDFSLQQALKKGPVVLYFFPAAFTAGCTLEAHDFAAATDTFNQLGATVIGVTAGNTDQISQFSKVECRDKFAVAADPGAKVAAEYHTAVQMQGKAMSERTSFVIAPDGKILMSYTDRNPDQHIQKALDAVKKYHSAH
ncbi:peroxiredoxin [Rosenbergiella australiborealis]|uniref:peroxiredoxin n=1 Tax=Rosenbergiella australiborealis TaxID=1544696 RepID=UPI003B8A7DEA